MTPKTQSRRRPEGKKAGPEFRRIDLAFLNIARRRVIPVTRGIARADVELVLPVWGVTGFPSAGSVRIRNFAIHPWVESSVDLRRMDYLSDILRQAMRANEQALNLLFRGRREDVERFSLVAECPAPPAEVKSSVAAVAGKFEEIFIAFEADWREDVSVVLDPLVIGIKAGESYLLAVYDPTKLEHYIASEFTAL